MKSRIAAGLVAVFVAAVVLAVWLFSGSSYDPPRRQGPPGLVQHGGVPSVWMLMSQAEHYRVGGGSRSSSSGRWLTRYHFDLHVFDAATAQRLWKKRLLTLKYDQAGYSATMRLLGQDGDAVWIFLNDRPVALSSKDGSVLGGVPDIEQRNAQLRGLLPAEQKFYTFDEGLVVTSADARHFRVRGADFAAQPYQPRSDEHFRYISFMSTQWNGGWQNKDFVVRQARDASGRWLGLYTEKEAADAGSDQFGEHLKRPDSVLTESGIQRRAFWGARIGKTRQFSEGAHDRLFDLARLPNTPEFLAGGLLISQGTKVPLALQAPQGFLVMHMTRNDEQRRLAFTRVDSALQPVWRSVMPFFEMDNRWQFPDRLLMRGSIEYKQPGEARWQEFLVSLDLKTGQMRGWNATLEAPASPGGAQGEWTTTARTP